MMDFSKLLGELLRRARKERGLTLDDVRRDSRGLFKPSAIGGYERGERSITLERFCLLSELYGIPADRLLAELRAKLAPEGRKEVVINLSRLSLLEAHEARVIADFVHKVRLQREDYLADVITLRSGDVETLAFASHQKPRSLLGRLAPALSEGERDPSPAVLPDTSQS